MEPDVEIHVADHVLPRPNGDTVVCTCGFRIGVMGRVDVADMDWHLDNHAGRVLIAGRRF